MKKNYQSAEMIFILISPRDVITASAEETESKYVELEPDA